MPSPSQIHVASVVSRSPQSIVYPIGKDRTNFNAANVTPFQWSVYDIVKRIPPGSVSTYGDIARHLDTSPRAVGNALRRNPFCPLVPCHRVVAANGKLGGFFGETKEGDVIDTKARMLRDEGVPLTTAPDGGWLISPAELKIRLWTGDGQ